MSGKKNYNELKHLANLLSYLRISGEVDPQRVLNENKNITSNLNKVIEESGWTKGSASSVVGNLIYHVANYFPPKALVHRPFLLAYVTSLKIRTHYQLDAAFAFFSASGSKKFDINEFETFCGIGITEAEASEIIKNTIDDVYEDYKTHVNVTRKSEDAIVNELGVYVQKRLQWVDPSIYVDYIGEKAATRKHIGQNSREKKNKGKYVEEFVGEEEKGPAKIKVHAKGVDIGQKPLNELFVLGDRIKAKITTSYETPYKPLFILPSKNEVENDPYCLLRIFARSLEVTYIICKISLYAVAWITSEENVVRVFKCEDDQFNEKFRKIKASIEKMPIFQYLKPNIIEYECFGSYIDLQQKAEKYRYEILLGRKQLEYAIYTLCRSNSLPKETTKALIISLQMLFEVMRLRQMKNFVRLYYENGKMPHPRLVNLQNNWSTMSEQLIKWAETGEYFEIIIDDVEYGVKDISRTIMIAKDKEQQS